MVDSILCRRQHFKATWWQRVYCSWMIHMISWDNGLPFVSARYSNDWKFAHWIEDLLIAPYTKGLTTFLQVWTNYDDARWCGVRDTAHEKLYRLLSDPIPEVWTPYVFVKCDKSCFLSNPFNLCWLIGALYRGQSLMRYMCICCLQEDAKQCYDVAKLNCTPLY